MKIFYFKALGLISILGIFVFSAGFHSGSWDLESEVEQIFALNCTTVGCHGGQFPAMNLNLEKGQFKGSLINVESRQKKEFKRVNPVSPDKSYLLLKLLGDEAISGDRMPLNAAALDKEQIEGIRKWISGFQPDEEKTFSGDNSSFIRPAFWGTRAINLITPRSIGKNKFLFRVSHRYYPEISGGYDVFCGLDGPASILISLGYGINDDLSITLARSNKFKEAMLSLKWVLFQQGKRYSLPFSAAVNLGTSIITESRPGIKTFSSDNTKFSFQLSLSHQLNNSISLLLVPAYASNVNHWENPSEGTLALVTGLRVMVANDVSILFEWIPVLSGYQEKSSGWGLGLEKKIGGHVFQVFILNTLGITTPQYLPGGDLEFKDSDFRLGFNIFRWF